MGTTSSDVAIGFALWLKEKTAFGLPMTVLGNSNNVISHGNCRAHYNIRLSLLYFCLSSTCHTTLFYMQNSIFHS
jgi:hypothetical protein